MPAHVMTFTNKIWRGGIKILRWAGIRNKIIIIVLTATGVGLTCHNNIHDIIIIIIIHFQSENNWQIIEQWL